MNNRLAPDTTDFAVLKTHPDYIDNTLFIHALEHSKKISNALLMPSGFFKTSALSMLKYFYDSDLQAGALFENTKVGKKPETMQHQGKYKVIYLDFAGVKGKNWAEMEAWIKLKIMELYLKEAETPGLLPSLSPKKLARFKKLCNNQADKWETEAALTDLAIVIARHTGKEIILLVDNTDDPLITAKINGYFNACHHFLKCLYADFTENHPIYINRALFMGRCYSGFFHYHQSILSSVGKGTFGKYFGFTERHLSDLLKRHDLNPTLATQFSEAYGGYEFYDITLHHPASVWAGIEAMQHGNTKLPLPIVNGLKPDEKALLQTLIRDNAFAITLLTNVLHGIPKKMFTFSIDRLGGYSNVDEIERTIATLISLGLLTNHHADKKTEIQRIQLCIPNRSAFYALKMNLLGLESPSVFINYRQIKKESHQRELIALAAELESTDRPTVLNALKKVDDLHFIKKEDPILKPMCSLAQSTDHRIQFLAWNAFYYTQHWNAYYYNLPGSSVESAFLHALMPRVTSPDPKVATHFHRRLREYGISDHPINCHNIKNTAKVIAQSYHQSGFFRAYKKEQLSHIACQVSIPNSISTTEAEKIAEHAIAVYFSKR